MDNKKTFVVIGGKWFDSANGNTYNSAKIIETDGEKNVYYTRFCYGYGSAYLQEAEQFIKEELKIKDFEIIDGGSFNLKKQEVKNGLF